MNLVSRSWLGEGSALPQSSALRKIQYPEESLRFSAEPRVPDRECAVIKKKTYRRHPAGTCGQVFPSTPENFSEGSRLSLVTRAQNSSLFHVSQQGTQQARLCRSRLPHIPELLAFPRKTSPYLSWCSSPNHEKRPAEHSVHYQRHALHAQGHVAARSAEQTSLTHLAGILGIVVPH